jgi:hypothetical protein
MNGRRAKQLRKAGLRSGPNRRILPVREMPCRRCGKLTRVRVDQQTGEINMGQPVYCRRQCLIKVEADKVIAAMRENEAAS